MATTRGILGQTAKVLFAVTLTDPTTGAAADPTGSPTIKVYLVTDAGALDLKATLAIAKLAATTGLWGAFQDISNTATWPAGDYQLVCSATVGGVATVATDTFEIDAATQGASGAFITDAYCTEAAVREQSTLLENVTAFPQALVISAAVQAAIEINLRIGHLYAVPFAAPYPDGIILVATWLSAAVSLRSAQSQRGNTNELAALLQTQADEALADIVAGKILLDDSLLADASGGQGGILSSTGELDPAFSNLDGPIGRY